MKRLQITAQNSIVKCIKQRIDDPYKTLQQKALAECLCERNSADEGS